MIKITIIGWYGTETIGDRAILAGLINLFPDVYEHFDIKLGSLYPTLSHRTVVEDYSFYTVMAKRHIFISIFDSTDVAELNSAIKWADMLVMGGGPLMDIEPMFMIEYAFKYAKKNRVKTALLGCGMGALIQERFMKSAMSIISNSDLTIFRDSKSLARYHELLKKEPSGCMASIDPAVFAADVFRKLYNSENSDKFAAINFRESDGLYNLGMSTEQIFVLFSELLEKTARNHDYELLLVPMHTFRIGGDDRYFLNQLAGKVNLPNVHVQNTPLSLVETMKIYYDAVFCIGMRFHSVLLQTAVNGKNYILDYTDINNGKIINLLHQLQACDFYKSRYYSLVHPDGDMFVPQENIPAYSIDDTAISDFRKIYIEHLKI
ncbi:MAG: polysaccharide pyruvyl transferase family protein [Prevotellaceae bacterium]|jgi:polysaccharide pyruvyl transferase WcaK-like protein|nr:polysaccharide pyruvyl transferase family protein [Prevotellaceae bacterium]